MKFAVSAKWTWVDSIAALVSFSTVHSLWCSILHFSRYFFNVYFGIIQDKRSHTNGTQTKWSVICAKTQLSVHSIARSLNVNTCGLLAVTLNFKQKKETQSKAKEKMSDKVEKPKSGGSFQIQYCFLWFDRVPIIFQVQLSNLFKFVVFLLVFFF